MVKSDPKQFVELYVFAHFLYVFTHLKVHNFLQTFFLAYFIHFRNLTS